jgi:hypothetical protein
MRGLIFSFAAMAAVSMAAPASAVVTVTETSGNLAAFSYSVNTATKTITIYETWGVNTLQNVLLKFEGWDYGGASWVINKHVTNDTGRDWTNFSHELLQSDLGLSPDNDGLSFAQLGIPQRPRNSDLFGTVVADELASRDYLMFSNGTVADGQTVFFTYGLTARRDTQATDPFYLRQAQPGVPEPATWAMLITGFGMVGLSVRRRRTTLGSVSA